MAERENLGSFLKENKKLVRDYLDTRLEAFKLKMIRAFSKSGGYFIWVIISLALIFLLLAFTGLVIGFWFTDMTGSYVKGFGYTTLIMLGIIIFLALFRKVLFVNPIIRKIIRRTMADNDDIDPGNN
ncbi:MAG: hypothetical protein E6H09_14015 [Bacteroidetes bacterium]|nr:MAG: hypothetical protein E6H09_14015 [Bacteroidota bacterium]